MQIRSHLFTYLKLKEKIKPEMPQVCSKDLGIKTAHGTPGYHVWAPRILFADLIGILGHTWKESFRTDDFSCKATPGKEFPGRAAKSEWEKKPRDLGPSLGHSFKFGGQGCATAMYLVQSQGAFYSHLRKEISFREFNDGQWGCLQEHRLMNYEASGAELDGQSQLRPFLI